MDKFTESLMISAALVGAVGGGIAGGVKLSESKANTVIEKQQKENEELKDKLADIKVGYSEEQLQEAIENAKAEEKQKSQAEIDALKEQLKEAQGGQTEVSWTNLRSNPAITATVKSTEDPSTKYNSEEELMAAVASINSNYKYYNKSGKFVLSDGETERVYKTKNNIVPVLVKNDKVYFEMLNTQTNRLCLYSMALTETDAVNATKLVDWVAASGDSTMFLYWIFDDDVMLFDNGGAKLAVVKLSTSETYFASGFQYFGSPEWKTDGDTTYFQLSAMNASGKYEGFMIKNNKCYKCTFKDGTQLEVDSTTELFKHVPTLEGYTVADAQSHIKSFYDANTSVGMGPAYSLCLFDLGEVDFSNVTSSDTFALDIVCNDDNATTKHYTFNFEYETRGGKYIALIKDSNQMTELTVSHNWYENADTSWNFVESKDNHLFIELNTMLSKIDHTKVSSITFSKIS